MSQGFYTLEEAANLLGMAPDDLNRMAQRREIRAFADRGSWRFRTQDIDEMAGNKKSGTATALAPSSGVGGVDTGIAPSSSGGADDISFEDISLDSLPLDESPKTMTAPRKGPTGVAGAAMEDDLVPADQSDDLVPADQSEDLIPADQSEDLIPADQGPEEPSTASADLGDLDSISLADEPQKPASSGRLAMQPSFDYDADTDALSADVPPSLSSSKLPGQSELKLGEQSSARLGSSAKLSSPSGKGGGGDSDVRLDFDSSSIDDSLIPIKPDSDVRLDPMSMTKPPSGPGGGDSSAGTEEIDLDAELQQAEQASLQRRGKTGQPSSSAQRKTKAVLNKGPDGGTVLPTSSPFELSEDDLELTPPSSSVRKYQPAGSEFELTLAPEDDANPLALGDDEDVDLGDLKPAGELSSAARAELSGINLHDPADSGISLEKAGASDSIDFELTVDDDATGPKTLKGKLPDSDSEFELTLEESGSGSISAGVEPPSSDSGEQKDIFETDFDLPVLEESGSQAVALEESDTDLESSDFDLALEGESQVESGSAVVALDEEEEGAAPAPKKRGFSSIHNDQGELVLDEDLAEDIEREAEGDDDDDLEPHTIPAAQAEWGLYPVLVLIPCVLLMAIAGIMSYELVRGMWGYHTNSKPSGMVVRGMAGLFTSEEDMPKP